MEIGCGEGRDAIFLLNKNYNIVAIDYSNTAIEKCKELSEYKYDNKFKQFDILNDKLDEKYDFIYSIAVIHMFVTEDHRNKFYKFIYEHLKQNGIALIVSMGDGEKIYVPNKNDSEEDLVTNGNNSEKENKLVNINTATVEELSSLPGIGQALAERIVMYRMQNGKFENIEAIKNVSGIGDSKFNNIKDMIKV